MTSATLEEALARHRAGRLDEAQALYEAVLRDDPNDPNALHLLGVLRNAQGALDDGIALIRAALRHAPDMAEAHYNLGNALSRTGAPDAALASYDAALALAPAHANALLNRGDVLRTLRRMAEAETCYRRALAPRPGDRHLLVRLGTVLRALGRDEEAAEAYRAVLAQEPHAVDAHFNLANALFDRQDFDGAARHYGEAALGQRAHPLAAGMRLASAMHACRWDDPSFPPDGTLPAQPIPPLTALTLSADGVAQQRQARLHAQRHGLDRPAPLPLAPRTPGPIRVGYLSADFHDHATAYLIADLFEAHDRQRVSVVGISYGPDDRSPRRARLVRGVDTFVDIRDCDDATAAQRIAALGLDILVDLKGYTADAREGLLRYRLAPVVVNYLGFPGTLGTPCVDYVLADPVVLPFADQPHYDERIVHLPHCYQPNDRHVTAAPDAGTRSRHGLPEDAFVFCCFNGSQKIAPGVFAAWMRILAAVPDSVLWLFAGKGAATAHLRAAAAAHGIDPVRLVPAPGVPHADHLARYRHANLFLDTAPYNAHTTASDALRMHVPLLTVQGTTFAGRVAASLLAAVGVPELVAPDLDAYVAMAVALAQAPARLEALRARIAQGVHAGPLFDTPLLARHIEDAYAAMQARAAAGLPPCSFAVAARG